MTSLDIWEASRVAFLVAAADVENIGDDLAERFGVPFERLGFTLAGGAGADLEASAHGEQADSTKGHPLPPTAKPGMTWGLVKPAHHAGKKK
jgi:hypothetical protein